MGGVGLENENEASDGKALPDKLRKPLIDVGNILCLLGRIFLFCFLFFFVAAAVDVKLFVAALHCCNHESSCCHFLLLILVVI